MTHLLLTSKIICNLFTKLSTEGRVTIQMRGMRQLWLRRRSHVVGRSKDRGMVNTRENSGMNKSIFEKMYKERRSRYKRFEHKIWAGQALRRDRERDDEKLTTGLAAVPWTSAQLNWP